MSSKSPRQNDCLEGVALTRLLIERPHCPAFFEAAMISKASGRPSGTDASDVLARLDPHSAHPASVHSRLRTSAASMIFSSLGCKSRSMLSS